ncbi:MAG: hypothetical protein WDM90_10525 [Ferruginibacter sp.]
MELIQKVFSMYIKNDKAENKFVLKNALKDLPILKPKNIKNNNDIENEDFGFYITQQKHHQISI